VSVSPTNWSQNNLYGDWCEEHTIKSISSPGVSKHFQKKKLLESPKRPSHCIEELCPGLLHRFTESYMPTVLTLYRRKMFVESRSAFSVFRPCSCPHGFVTVLESISWLTYCFSQSYFCVTSALVTDHYPSRYIGVVTVILPRGSSFDFHLRVTEHFLGFVTKTKSHILCHYCGYWC
jgi:hypothetical protein